MRDLTPEEVEAYIKNPSFCPWCKSEDISSTGSPDFVLSHGEWIVRCDTEGCYAMWVEEFRMLGIRALEKKEEQSK